MLVAEGLRKRYRSREVVRDFLGYGRKIGPECAKLKDIIGKLFRLRNL